MGIKPLSEWLKKNFPELFETIHISEYAFKKVAVDVSLYIYQFKYAYQENFLSGFIKFVSCLRENEIHPVFIFDGKAPAEKDDERQKRRDAREKMKEKIYLLEEAVENFKINGEIDQLLIDLQNKKGFKKPLLGRGINIKAIEYQIDQMRKQVIEVSPADFENAKTLFSILDIQHFQAPEEAETCCADLCLQGKVDAVLSEDTDLIAYKCPVFLSKIDVKTETCVRLRYDKILESVGLSQESFLDLLIMMGCDYNKNIPMVGPVKAFKLIQTYDNIENIEKSGLDISILKHIRCREIFSDYKRTKEKVLYVGTPDMGKLALFLQKKNIRTDMAVLEKAFIHTINVVFEGDEKPVKRTVKKVVRKDAKIESDSDVECEF